MSNFNILEHVLDHAAFIINGLPETDEKLLHFNASVDISYFILNGFTSMKEVDERMKKFLHNIHEKVFEFQEINRTYVKKNGEISKYMKTRKTSFKTMLLVYHNSHPNATKNVHPHIHILHRKNERLGKNYSYLIKALSEEANKLKIKFNFMEEPRSTGLTKAKEKALEHMGWIFNQNIKDEILKYIIDEKLLKCLNDLQRHYEVSENISYYIKTFNIVNQRLFEMNIDFGYNGVNLKDYIPLRLLEKHDLLLSALEVCQKVRLDLTNVLDREILKFIYGFESETMKLLSEEYSLDVIDKSLITFDEDFLHKNENIKTFEGTLSFYDCVKEDTLKAIEYAKDLNEFKENMNRFGYQDVSIGYTKSSQKSYPSGVRMTTPSMKSKLNISFSDIGIGWNIIKHIFDKNKKEKQLNMDNKSKLESYVPKEPPKIISKKTLDIVHKVRKKLLIFNHGNASLNYLNLLDNEYDVVRSDMYDITTLRHKNGTVIVDYGTHLELKEDRNKREGVDAMLDIAKLKGWKASSLDFRGDDSCVVLSKLLAKKILIDGKEAVISHKNDNPRKL
jgi:hypothetical protein